MKQSTLDLLDADLRQGHVKHMSMDDDVHWKTYRQSLVISPKYWQDYQAALQSQTFRWTEVKYTLLHSHLSTMNAKLPGLYLFVVRPGFLIQSLPQFVFYVGISGEHGSLRPLRQRLKDYLSLEQVRKRKNVHKNLQLYYPVVYVVYTLLRLSHAKLESLEEAMHGYFYPWAGRRDFPVPIKNAQKAWGAV
ncbi:MAG: hypothetical protein IPK26_22265 [Planctomycetes bacterium]|nr:hypothetical protein [Planctomycetota bacterium]